ncbi:MAG: glutamate racemase [Clostridia bacterium]|nr:glutamate racemase [Clostridia bacterium]
METITKLGVFDSGLGGLTVLNEICKYNTGLEITYFGDTARVPYGSRTPETIARYAEQDVRFLLSCGVEAIVIACGTVSATCLHRLRQRYRIPILGVIEPAAKQAASLSQTGHIGVIGTNATIKSDAYTKEIRAVRPDSRVTGVACPLFVPLIENGFAPDDPIVKLTVERYLAPLADSDMDTLILGCTHYPFLSETIHKVLPSVQLINIGTVLAKSLRSAFPLTADASPDSVSYFVSDTDTEFQRIANASLDAIHADTVTKINIEQF